jgi:GGDEF domain-containing protein
MITDLDLVTVAVMTALVVFVAGSVFLLETVLRRDEPAGRMWALGFLGAIMTSLLYLVWAQDPAAQWAVVAGNAAFVGGTGAMWIGCRVFNRRRVRAAAAVVGALAAASAIATVVETPLLGDWAGAAWTFAGIVVTAAAAGVECFRGTLGGMRTAWVLGAVFLAEGVFFLLRLGALLVLGSEDEVFQTWFGSVVVGMLTVILIVVAVIVTSVLRAGRAELRDLRAPADDADAVTGILPGHRLRTTLDSVTARARRRHLGLAVLEIRLDDLDHIATAFGNEARREVVTVWRQAVRTHAPLFAVLGEDGDDGIVLVTTAASAADARREAMSLYRGVFDALGQLPGVGLPVMGVGVALTEIVGHDAAALLRVARASAERGFSSADSAVVVARTAEV